jgi:hypothetical protein
MIYVIEGPDGTGKTTLARFIADSLKASIIHCSYDKDWDMKEYHTDVMESALVLNEYKSVIVDRWAISEEVYGKVFREGPSYDTSELIDRYKRYITWIYCRNDDAIENHFKNKEIRYELYDDMTEVVELYDSIVQESQLPWQVYDFNKVNKKEFTERINHG